MSITFQKRQKEMKRIEKQKEKAQRRAEKKLAKKDGDKVVISTQELEPMPADLQALFDDH